MITDTRDKIVAYIKRLGQARVQDLYEYLHISKAAIHRQLKKLLLEGSIERVGKPPLVFYNLSAQTTTSRLAPDVQLPVLIKQTIDDNFLSITPEGKLLYGIDGFVYWAQRYQKNKSIADIAHEYAQTLQLQKQHFSTEGWIDATAKLTDTFQKTSVTRLLCADIYSYKAFGRTKMAKLVMYAKQIGDRRLIGQISDIVKPVIEKIIIKYSVNAVVYIPPTVPRPIQFMDELKTHLDLQVPEILLVKVIPGDIPIPQKTLTTLSERVINARGSIYVKTNTGPVYKNVLMIDDVVGSGASFHETAEKLKRSNYGRENLIAFGLVGNIKGYDVIREI